MTDGQTDRLMDRWTYRQTGMQYKVSSLETKNRLIANIKKLSPVTLAVNLNIDLLIICQKNF